MAITRRTADIKDPLPLLRLMLYGLGGTGKTHLAASFADDPRSAPVLLINSGGNPEMVLVGESPPLVVDLDSYRDLDVIYDFLAGGQPANHNLRTTLGWPNNLVFKTVVIDTLSDLQQQVVVSAANPRYTSGKFSALQKPDIQSWQKIGTWTVNMARDFLRLPLNIILVLQQKTKIDIERGASEIRPALDGQSAEIVPAWVHLMGQMEQVRDSNGDLVPKVWWESTTGHSWTKNQLAPRQTVGGKQLDGLGRGMQGPTASRILDAVENYYKTLIEIQEANNADQSK